MFRDKLKTLIKKNNGETEGNDKKTIENLVFFIIILIITIVIINIIWKGNKTGTKEQENNTSSSKQLATTQTVNNTCLESSDNSVDLEERLEGILSKIQGVGDVKVLINYSESSEVVAMYNENSKTSTTDETDTSGGNRQIQEIDIQKEVVYQEEDGNKTPITQKIINPKVEGAIITAKGAMDANVKSNIIQAVEAVTGLATHKVQVFTME